jgi:PilZ domain-containing protein
MSTTPIVTLPMLSGFIERRKSERLAVRTPAKIMLPHSNTPLDCVATNVSDGGALLHVRSADLPDIFMLHFTDSGRQRHCRVAWRKGAEVGVAFTDRSQPSFGRRIANR